MGWSLGRLLSDHALTLVIAECGGTYMVLQRFLFRYHKRMSGPSVVAGWPQFLLSCVSLCCSWHVIFHNPYLLLLPHGAVHCTRSTLLVASYLSDFSMMYSQHSPLSPSCIDPRTRGKHRELRACQHVTAPPPHNVSKDWEMREIHPSYPKGCSASATKTMKPGEAVRGAAAVPAKRFGCWQAAERVVCASALEGASCVLQAIQTRRNC